MSGKEIGIIEKVDKTLEELVKLSYTILYANFEEDLTLRYIDKNNELYIDNKNIKTYIDFNEVKKLKQKDVVNILLCDIFI